MDRDVKNPHNAEDWAGKDAIETNSNFAGLFATATLDRTARRRLSACASGSESWNMPLQNALLHLKKPYK